MCSSDLFDIPTQLSLEETPQYPEQTDNLLLAFTSEVDPSEVSRRPFPTQDTKKIRVENSVDNRVEKRVVQQKVSPVEDTEEHVLFEITLASKSVKNISNPVPKRQKR